MSEEVMRPWEQRRHMDTVRYRAELAKAEAEAVGNVTAYVITKALEVGFVRAEAQRLDPQSAELYNLLALRGVQELGEVISDVRRDWR